MKTVAVIGGGPAGLMAAEKLAEAGISVTVYERKPTVARKFLMAGRGGLNITHSEGMQAFLTRYGDAAQPLTPVISSFSPPMLRDWCARLGEETFIGSSGRVFPKSFKASPLLRAWQKRLSAQGVKILTRHNWRGWDETGALSFETDDGKTVASRPDATLLALGGASWPKLGSDGSWQEILTARGIALSPLRPANCGFVFAWSPVFSQKFAGQPLKPVILRSGAHHARGEIMITQKGIEGGAVYALSRVLREAVEEQGTVVLLIDTRPDVPVEQLQKRLSAERRGLSFSNFLRRHGGLSPAAIGLLREICPTAGSLTPADLASLIKSLPLQVRESAAIDRAISSAGGITWQELDEKFPFMLKKAESVFAAGEMIDWEAPTGGYLLQATFATAVAAANGILRYLNG